MALSNKCVQAFLRFRMGSHSLPCVTGRVANIPRAQRVCTLCQTGNLGDEQHLVFECPALQGFRDRYNGLFGDHAATMIQSCGNMTLVQLRNSSKNVWTHTVILALRARHQISPRWLETMQIFSLYTVHHLRTKLRVPLVLTCVSSNNMTGIYVIQSKSFHSSTCAIPFGNIQYLSSLPTNMLLLANS